MEKSGHLIGYKKDTLDINYQISKTGFLVIE